MLLAQGRYWRVSWTRSSDVVALALHRESLPEELREVRELRIDVPTDQWKRVVKQVRSDRKLLGGILLDFARPKDQLSAAVASDRLLAELQRVVLDATASLVECGALTLVPVASVE